MRGTINGVTMSNMLDERFVCSSRAAVDRVLGKTHYMYQDALDLLGKWGAVVITYRPRNGKPWRISIDGCHRG